MSRDVKISRRPKGCDSKPCLQSKHWNDENGKHHEDGEALAVADLGESDLMVDLGWKLVGFATSQCTLNDLGVLEDLNFGKVASLSFTGKFYLVYSSIMFDIYKSTATQVRHH